MPPQSHKQKPDSCMSVPQVLSGICAARYTRPLTPMQPAHAHVAHVIGSWPFPHPDHTVHSPNHHLHMEQQASPAATTPPSGPSKSDIQQCRDCLSHRSVQSRNPKLKQHYAGLPGQPQWRTMHTHATDSATPAASHTDLSRPRLRLALSCTRSTPMFNTPKHISRNQHTCR